MIETQFVNFLYLFTRLFEDPIVFLMVGTFFIVFGMG